MQFYCATRISADFSTGNFFPRCRSNQKENHSEGDRRLEKNSVKRNTQQSTHHPDNNKVSNSRVGGDKSIRLSAPPNQQQRQQPDGQEDTTPSGKPRLLRGNNSHHGSGGQHPRNFLHQAVSLSIFNIGSYSV